MKITIEFHTDNASFEDYYDELNSVLSDVINRVIKGRLEGAIIDSNGNTIGNFDVMESK